MAQGWRIVQFSVATMSVKSPEKRAEIAKIWGTTPGLASTALRTVLADKIDIADQKAANEQREALSAILSIKPLSSQGLALAVRRAARDRSANGRCIGKSQAVDADWAQ